MPYRDPEKERAFRRTELLRLRERRRALRAGLLPPHQRGSVPDPDDYAHPDSDVRRGP